MTVVTEGIMHEDKFKVKSCRIMGCPPYVITVEGKEAIATTKQGLKLLYHTLGRYLAADEKS
jgi:hypothetical protein